MPVPIHLRDYLIEWPLLDEENEKSYFETTHRVCSPDETFRRIASLRERAGITRLSEITDLDCIGIPTYMAVRPAVDCFDENITVYNGKGLTQAQAKVSALMEAFERYSAERHDRPTLLESLNEIDRYGTPIDIRRLILPPRESYQPDQLVEWVCGFDLLSGEVRYVPAAAVFFPYRPENEARFFNEFSDTNGLASGNTLAEAISQALAEVIERDAETVAAYRKSAVTIDLSTIESPLIRSLVEQYRRAGIGIVVKEITSELGIPTFFAVIDDPATENPGLLCSGFGTHVNAEIAMMRAMTEAAQSRCTVISGAREDIVKDGYKQNENYHDLKKRMGYVDRVHCTHVSESDNKS